jgi:NAD(P)-dependent dehydrogenase (short-subunit alcohol dehydrogenase family)
MKLANRLAFITGGGRGIGRAIAFAFAREGATVCVAARSVDQVQEVADGIKTETGLDSFGVICDVTETVSVQLALEETQKHFNRAPDILVNNAGIAQSAPLVKTSDELWNKIIATNLTGVFNCTRAALPAMLESGWGRVINVASIAGKLGAQYVSAYTASKHGVIGLTRSAAMETALRGVTVNALCPGYVETDMADLAIRNISTRTGKSEAEALEFLKAMSPQNRLTTPAEVAALAVLLASEDGRGINGQAINIDGGTSQY